MNALDQAPRSVGRVVLYVATAGAVLLILPSTANVDDIKRLVVGALAGVLGLVLAAGALRGGGGRNAFAGPLVAMLLVYANAALWSGHRLTGASETLRIGSLAIVCAGVACAFPTMDTIKRLCLVFCVAAGLASVYAMAQRMGYDFFPWADRSIPEYLDLPATYGNPNFAGHALVFAVVLSVWLASERGTRWCIALTALFLVHLWLTKHRAGLMALTAALIVTVVAARVSHRATTSARAFVIVLTAGAAIGVTALAAVAGAQYARSGRPYPLDASLLLRYNGYLGAARMVSDRPLLGFGPGAYAVENTAYWTPYEREHFARDFRYNTHAHNDPIETAVDAGLPALFLFLLLTLGGMYRGVLASVHGVDRRERRWGLAVTGLFAAFAVDSCFGFPFYAPVSSYLWAVALGMAASTPTGPAFGAGAPSRMRWPMAACVALLGVACAADAARTFYAQYCLAQGRAARAVGALDASDAYLRSGARAAPERYVLRHERGEALALRNDPNGAAREFRAALEQDPRYVPSLAALAKLNLDAGLRVGPPQSQQLLAEARRWVERVLEICPDLPEALELQARAALHEGAAFLNVESPTPEQRAQGRAALESARDGFQRAIAAGAPDAAAISPMLDLVNERLRALGAGDSRGEGAQWPSQ